MRVIKVGVTRAFTLNLGNYESAKVGAWVEIEVEGDDDPEEAYQLASDFVHDKVSQDLSDLDPNAE